MGTAPAALPFSRSFPATREALNDALRYNLPVTFRGYTTHFGEPDPEDGGVRVSETITGGPVEHLISFYTIDQFWQQELGADPYRDPDPVDWLTFHEHVLLSLTAGKIFHDGLDLEFVRRRFAYYPHDIWLYLLAAQWSLISQEEAFVGRTWQVGDRPGARIITARLAERFMRLAS